MRSSKVLIVILALNISTMAYALSPALAIIISVPGNAGPWDPILNNAFSYGVHDQTSPAIVDVASGLSFAPSTSLTLQYLSGTVSVGNGLPFTDGLGLTTLNVSDYNSVNGVFPSFHINPASDPTFSGELIGTFVNQAGTIVGSPFVFGNGALTVGIPTGASRLQLGINDNLFSDNIGLYMVGVTGSSVDLVPVPEPASGVLLALGITGLLLRRIFAKICKSFEIYGCSNA